MDSIISHQPLNITVGLNKLVAGVVQRPADVANAFVYWAGNGIVDRRCRSRRCFRTISPLRLLAPTPKALYSPREIRHLAIIVNLEYDPTAAFRNKVIHFDFRKLDVFSFGEEQNCLIGSIDLLYRNRGTKCASHPLTASRR